MLGFGIHNHQSPGFSLVLAVDGADIDPKIVGTDPGGAVKLQVNKLVGQLFLQLVLHFVRRVNDVLSDTLSAGPNSDLPGKLSITLQKLYLLILKQEVF